MRAIAMLLLFLSVAVTCYADDDPLESLNSVQETLSTMEKSLEAQAWQENDDPVAVGILEPVESEGFLDRNLEPEAAGSMVTGGSVRSRSARVAKRGPWMTTTVPPRCCMPMVQPSGAA